MPPPRRRAAAPPHSPLSARVRRVPPQQAAFNKEKSEYFFKNAANISSATFHPKDLLKSGCDADLIGLGTLHVHAPPPYPR